MTPTTMTGRQGTDTVDPSNRWTRATVALAAACGSLLALTPAALAADVANPAQKPFPIEVTIDGQTYRDGEDTLPGYDDQQCTPIPGVQYDFAANEIQYYEGSELVATAPWTEWARISSYETWLTQQSGAGSGSGSGSGGSGSGSGSGSGAAGGGGNGAPVPTPTPAPPTTETVTSAPGKVKTNKPRADKTPSPSRPKQQESAPTPTSTGTPTASGGGKVDPPPAPSPPRPGGRRRRWRQGRLHREVEALGPRRHHRRGRGPRPPAAPRPPRRIPPSGDARGPDRGARRRCRRRWRRRPRPTAPADTRAAGIGILAALALSGIGLLAAGFLRRQVAGRAGRRASHDRPRRDVRVAGAPAASALAPAPATSRTTPLTPGRRPSGAGPGQVRPAPRGARRPHAAGQLLPPTHQNRKHDP